MTARPDFTLWPAIDLRHGRVVRLSQGRDDARTEYGDNPAAVAASFVADGASAVHVVDLDAAFGDGNNRAAIAEIVRTVGPAVRVQVGGGVRDDAAVDELLGWGVARVVVGSAAVERPGWVAELVARHGAERIIIGLDARDGEVRLRGWVAGSGRHVSDVAREMADAGATETVFTNIANDGMLTGPDLAASLEVAQSGLRVVVSGGVGQLDDVAAAYARRNEGLAGIIVGRALYEGRFTVAQALGVCRA
jgi:phosphoribosylformimino-5-aminoimidazole carboxamide ribotide isomerase